MKKLLAAAFVLALSAGPAFASSCPLHMKAIDEAMAKMPTISADQMSRVKSLRADGETKHKAGDHTGSMASLSEAEKILGISK